MLARCRHAESSIIVRNFLSNLRLGCVSLALTVILIAQWVFISIPEGAVLTIPSLNRHVLNSLSVGFGSVGPF
jgi:hypothetical protein